MFGLLRYVLGLRGPLGVVAFAVAAGTGVGLLVANAVLAAWTYRDASRRDLRAPGRWALAVLLGGLFAFVPYLLVQRATDWSSDSRGLRAARRAVDEGRAVSGVGAGPSAESPTSTPTAASDDGSRNPEMAEPPAARGGRSLALVAARYGWKAGRLGARGVGWAGRRAARELAD